MQDDEEHYRMRNILNSLEQLAKLSEKTPGIIHKETLANCKNEASRILSEATKERIESNVSKMKAKALANLDDYKD